MVHAPASDCNEWLLLAACSGAKGNLKGEPVPITRLDRVPAVSHRFPSFFPMAAISCSMCWEFRKGPVSIWVARRRQAEAVECLKHSRGCIWHRVGVRGLQARADVLGKGSIAFMRGTTLIAQSLDVDRRELTGEPIRVADPVGTMNEGAEASPYRPPVISRIAWAPLTVRGYQSR